MGGNRNRNHQQLQWTGPAVRSFSGPVQSSCGLFPVHATGPANTSIRWEVTDNQTIYMLDNDIPDATSWLETLEGLEFSWLHALLTSRTIVQGKSYIDNPIHCLLTP